MDEKRAGKIAEITRPIKSLESEIAKSGKIGLKLEGHIKPGTELDFLNDFLDAMSIKDAKKYDFNNVAIYSPEMGILILKEISSKMEKIPFFKERPITTSYFWADETGQNGVEALYYHGDNVFYLNSITKNGTREQKP